jgi:2-oxoglutarate ferredoxin oxidoreductase subunit alpha
MEKTDVTLLIGGEAGQGLVTLGDLLARSLVRAGYFVVVTQSYHSRIRGGHNTFAIRASTESIASPRESVDLLIAMNAETVTLHKAEVADGGLIVADAAHGTASDNCLQVPYHELGEQRFANVVALGVVSLLLGLDQDLLAQTLDDVFAKKDPQLAEKNQQVLTGAFNWCDRQTVDFPKLPAVDNQVKRLLMNGNQAIAMGALSAGLKFCSFYPMTPATSIVLNLAAQAGRMGLVVEQAEDEIAGWRKGRGRLPDYRLAPSRQTWNSFCTPVTANFPGRSSLPGQLKNASGSHANHLKWRPSFRALSFSSLTNFSPTPPVLLHLSILTTWSRLNRG